MICILVLRPRVAKYITKVPTVDINSGIYLPIIMFNQFLGQKYRSRKVSLKGDCSGIFKKYFFG